MLVGHQMMIEGLATPTVQQTSYCTTSPTTVTQTPPSVKSPGSDENTARKPRKGTPVKLCTTPPAVHNVLPTASRNLSNFTVNQQSVTNLSKENVHGMVQTSLVQNPTSVSTTKSGAEGSPLDLTRSPEASATTNSVENAILNSQVLMLNGKRFEIVPLGDGRWVTRNEYEIMKCLEHVRKDPSILNSSDTKDKKADTSSKAEDTDDLAKGQVQVVTSIDTFSDNSPEKTCTDSSQEDAEEKREPVQAKAESNENVTLEDSMQNCVQQDFYNGTEEEQDVFTETESVQTVSVNSTAYQIQNIQNVDPNTSDSNTSKKRKSDSDIEDCPKQRKLEEISTTEASSSPKIANGENLKTEEHVPSLNTTDINPKPVTTHQLDVLKDLLKPEDLLM